MILKPLLPKVLDHKPTYKKIYSVWTSRAYNFIIIVEILQEEHCNSGFSTFELNAGVKPGSSTNQHSVTAAVDSEGTFLK